MKEENFEELEDNLNLIAPHHAKNNIDLEDFYL